MSPGLRGPATETDRAALCAVSPADAQRAWGSWATAQALVATVFRWEMRYSLPLGSPEGGAVREILAGKGRRPQGNRSRAIPRASGPQADGSGFQLRLCNLWAMRPLPASSTH